MSRTYEILCHDCRRKLWIGQDHLSRPPFLYTTPKHLKALETFLFDHVGHRLSVSDSNDVPDEDDDWVEIEVDDAEPKSSEGEAP